MDTIRFCAKCGHELTVGAEFCPYCGNSIQNNNDPVSAGARYEHYEENDDSVEEKAKWEGRVPLGATSVIHSNPETTPAMMTCFKCGNTIPADSKYCPICQVQLFVVCPKCGHRYSAQYMNCNECGTNRDGFLKAQEIAAWLKQIEEKRLKEEDARQRKLQEEAREQAEKRRLASMPKITLFDGAIRHSNSGDSVCLRWKTENVEYCDLSWYKKREKCWYKCIPDRYYAISPFVNLPANRNEHTFDGSELLDMCSLIGSSHQIQLCLEAFSKSGEHTSKDIIINVLTFWFSPLQVTSIETT